jgi:hypothetical protein
VPPAVVAAAALVDAPVLAAVPVLLLSLPQAAAPSESPATSTAAAHR